VMLQLNGRGSVEEATVGRAAFLGG